MKIILENELEKWAWGVMMSAHRKWEKNHGSVLQDQMGWYFKDLFKDEREEIIKKEVERRLWFSWGDDYRLSEEEYVSQGLANWDDAGKELSVILANKLDNGRREFEEELREEYKTLQEDIVNVREALTETVKEELREFYYIFFNAPENLTVYYNGEVVQGKK